MNGALPRVICLSCSERAAPYGLIHGDPERYLFEPLGRLVEKEHCLHIDLSQRGDPPVTEQLVEFISRAPSAPHIAFVLAPVLRPATRPDDYDIENGFLVPVCDGVTPIKPIVQAIVESVMGPSVVLVDGSAIDPVHEVDLKLPGFLIERSLDDYLYGIMTPVQQHRSLCLFSNLIRSTERLPLRGVTPRPEGESLMSWLSGDVERANADDRGALSRIALFGLLGAARGFANRTGHYVKDEVAVESSGVPKKTESISRFEVLCEKSLSFADLFGFIVRALREQTGNRISIVSANRVSAGHSFWHTHLLPAPPA